MHTRLFIIFIVLFIAVSWVCRWGSELLHFSQKKMAAKNEWMGFGCSLALARLVASLVWRRWASHLGHISSFSSAWAWFSSKFFMFENDKTAKTTTTTTNKANERFDCKVDRRRCDKCAVEMMHEQQTGTMSADSTWTETLVPKCIQAKCERNKNVKKKKCAVVFSCSALNILFRHQSNRWNSRISDFIWNYYSSRNHCALSLWLHSSHQSSPHFYKVLTPRMVHVFRCRRRCRHHKSSCIDFPFTLMWYTNKMRTWNSWIVFTSSMNILCTRIPAHSTTHMGKKIFQKFKYFVAECEMKWRGVNGQ